MRIFLTVALLFLLPYAAEGQWKEPLPLWFSVEDAGTLCNQLLKAVEPDMPENAYMPPFLKQKLRWVYQQTAVGRLKLNLTLDMRNQLPSHVLMQASVVEGVPVIEISAKRLILLVRIELGTPTGFTQEQKNSFAIALAHEATHHEKPTVRNKPRKAMIEEEVRVWTKIDELVVKELLEIGQPMIGTFVEFHALRNKCAGAKNCAGIREWVEGMLPK